MNAARQPPSLANRESKLHPLPVRVPVLFHRPADRSDCHDRPHKPGRATSENSPTNGHHTETKLGKAGADLCNQGMFPHPPKAPSSGLETSEVTTK